MRHCLILCVWGILGASALAEDQTWPQWRGPNRDGVIQAPAWPDSIEEGQLTLRWQEKLDPSYSGPIIAGDRIYTTETRDLDSEFVMAFDRASGKKVWEVGWPGKISVPFFAKENGSWIRATPALDGDSLYVGGIRDVLACIDAKTGSVRWKVDFVQELKAEVPAFGMVCSPLVIGDHVYVQAGACFVKLDKHTGKILWRTLQDDGGMMGSAFSSPTLAKIGGADQLLVQTRTKLAGVDPETGKELWTQEIEAFRGMNILTPVVFNEKVFTTAYGGQSHLFELSHSGEGWQPKEVWQTKQQGYMSTPVVIDGHAYIHLKNQRFACIDLSTGTETWTTKPFGKYWSLVANGDKILALDESGILRLIAANPKEYTLLDERQVSSESAWAHLAICGSDVCIRSLRSLAVYDWKK
jgi:outer membrane protein assembly factor BamB